MLNKNDVITCDVTDLNNLGFGVAHVDGMTLFIANAVDGDQLRVKIISVKRTYAIAKIETILTPSPYRIEAPCGVNGCGGCAYQHISYSHEKDLKRSYVATAFRKAGVDATVADVVTAMDETGNPLIAHYRNKAQYPVTQDADGHYVIGFYGAKSHRVLEAGSCQLQPQVFSQIVEILREFFVTTGIPTYREDTKTGVLRHIYLRRATVSGEILVALVINGTALPDEERLVEVLRQGCCDVVGVLLNVNTADTNVICGEEWRTLWGRNYLVDTLAGVTLRIAPAAFYQVNHDAAELLYAHAADVAELSENECVFDLYCGCGSIGLSMAGRVREVVGVDIEQSAIKCAILNAEENKIANARFYCGDAGTPGQLLNEAIQFEKTVPDVVVLDPPRKGCTLDLLHYLIEVGVRKIVYVSCNPDTLARDASVLCNAGYRLGIVTPFDLFPRTGHVESVCLLEKK